ncbi:hypothetical protein FOVG_05769 [Fusarium oxysporum f. sp. pisi HDV247]|uniref:DUF6594 domain-containing protein n=1 Tax=Fusarium oxysporum f. sp. pisi HDV247 TaxID=1080344 RepID=W9PPS7_FUSOX|nr:hypothetical protein FOVG_05769 [Fusarium oxysporum f. sp. pisi HDV247]
MANDIERGSLETTIKPTFVRSVLTWASSWRVPGAFSLKSQNEQASGVSSDTERITVEDRRKGYPRFSALMAGHSSFQIYRRFSDLRTRLLLLTQDEIVELEEQLNQIDQAEKSALFLASRREDRNSDRSVITTKLRSALSAYDELLEGSQRSLKYESPHEKYVSSLQRWLSGNSCIARSETKFLKNSDDLLSLCPREDGIVAWLERNVCDKVVRRFSRSSENISNDPHVQIFSRSSTMRVARAILSPLIVFLLLAPVVICNMIDSQPARLAIMIISTAAFVCCMSLLTNAKTVELAVAGATYTTVMIVFVSNTD